MNVYASQQQLLFPVMLSLGALTKSRNQQHSFGGIALMLTRVCCTNS